MRKTEMKKTKKNKGKISPNERIVELQDKRLKKLIKVIKPSRPSTIYDRME